MPIQAPTTHPQRAPQTVRGWPSLLPLGAVCALFVFVVLTVVTPPAEPSAALVPAEPGAALPEPPLGA